MNKINTIGVDLAKNVIQVSVVSGSNHELTNKSLTRKKFAEFLARQKPSLVAFEACGTAHYWGRFAQRHGHEVKIIPAKMVAPYRQGHKTDANDAFAVAEAARRPDIRQAPLKSVEQQGMQSIQRSRELLVRNRVGLSNHVRGLLLEFGLVIPQGWAALHRRIPEILEDGENELPDMYRATLHMLWRRLCELRTDIEQLDIPMPYILGENDESIPTAASVNYLQSLKSQSGKDIEIRVIPGVDHTMITNASFVSTGGYVPAFLDEIGPWVAAKVSAESPGQ